MQRRDNMNTHRERRASPTKEQEKPTYTDRYRFSGHADRTIDPTRLIRVYKILARLECMPRGR